jgi:hypothetical protein
MSVRPNKSHARREPAMAAGPPAGTNAPSLIEKSLGEACKTALKLLEHCNIQIAVVLDSSGGKDVVRCRTQHGPTLYHNKTQLGKKLPSARIEIDGCSLVQ